MNMIYMNMQCDVASRVTLSLFQAVANYAVKIDTPVIEVKLNIPGFISWS